MTERILLFDGVCNLCNASVDFVIRHDGKQRFRFASLQSEFGQKVLKEHELDQSDIDSVVYLENGNVHLKSSAALRIFLRLGGLWPLMGVFIIVPPFLRNVVYDLIAKNRYRWFGRKETCRVPTQEERARFLG